MNGSHVSLLSVFCGALVLLAPLTMSQILAASNFGSSGSTLPAAINRIGDALDAVEDDDDDDDELEVSGGNGDCGCERNNEADLLYPNPDDADENDDRDYATDDRYT